MKHLFIISIVIELLCNFILPKQTYFNYEHSNQLRCKELLIMESMVDKVSMKLMMGRDQEECFLDQRKIKVLENNLDPFIIFGNNLQSFISF